MEELKRRNGENKFDYIVRLVKGKDDGSYDIDYVELFKLAFDVELSSCECRKRFYGLKMLIENLDDEKMNNVIKNATDESILNELELKKIELKKERVKKNTITLELNRMLREEGRDELKWEKVKQSIDRVQPYEFKEVVVAKQENNHGIVGITDMHYDKAFVSLNNEYSVDILKERLELTMQKIVNWAMKNDITYIDVVNTGDSVDGLIHMTQLKSLQNGLIDSTIQYSRLMADWLNRLSSYFLNVTYRHVISSNHTEIRPFGSKAGKYPEEDLEKVIVNYIHDILVNNDRIDVVVDYNQYTEFIVNDNRGIALHGHQLRKIKTHDIISSLEKVLHKEINFVIQGHLHHLDVTTVGEGSNGMNKKVIKMPAFMGSDIYSDGLFTGSCPAITLMQFYNDGIDIREVQLNKKNK